MERTSSLGRFSKLFGALIGVVTPSGLVGLLAIYGVGLTESQAGLILGAVIAIGSALGVYVAPANTPKPAKPVDDSTPVAAAPVAEVDPTPVVATVEGT